MRAVALISGGLDSVVAAWVARSDADIAVALTFDYGQRAAAREIQAAGNVAQRLGCEHIVIELPWLGKLGQSALTDVSADVPEIAPDQLDDADRTEKTAAAVWVPSDVPGQLAGVHDPCGSVFRVLDAAQAEGPESDGRSEQDGDCRAGDRDGCAN